MQFLVHLHLQVLVDSEANLVCADGGVEIILGRLRSLNYAATTPWTTTGSSHANTRIRYARIGIAFYVFYHVCQ